MAIQTTTLNHFGLKHLPRYTPDFLILKRRSPGKYQDYKSKGEIVKILIIETKGDIYYNDQFKQKEKFVKETFLIHNPNFNYICFIDKGKNDFTIHLNELRNFINDL